MAADPMPAAEVDIDAGLVRALLEQQHPDLASLPLGLVGEGWDNVTFRLGDELSVRLPRRAMSARLVLHEQRWLPELAPRLPLSVPVPVRVGEPNDRYPWSWSICPWLPGEIAAVTRWRDARSAAETLGAFVRALGTPAPPNAPDNPYRGVPLALRHEVTVARIDQLSASIDGPSVRALWEDLCATAPWSGPSVWLHGDLHPANLLVVDGQLTAVIDFGDITAGDPATDLAAGWMVFSGAELDAFRHATGDHDDDTWARARGWALAHGLACLSSSADNPTMDSIGRRTLATVMSAGR